MTPILAPARRRPRVFARGGVARAWSALWLVLYTLVVVGAPVVDAGAEHAPVAAHWESSSSPECPASHEGLDCQLCQVLTSARHLEARVALPPATVRTVASAIVSTEQFIAAASERGLPSGRSPPAV